MTEQTDLQRVRDFARTVGEAVPRVQEVYFVGSRATGHARADADFDIMVTVTGRCRAGWRRPAHSPMRGLPKRLDGVPIDWCLLPAAHFDRAEMEGLGGVLMWSRCGLEA